MQTFIPPNSVALEARKGLELRSAQPKSNRCCTPVGIRRASQLANRQPVSENTLKRMVSYFSRHSVDRNGKGWGIDSKGYQAWLCWGGDAGRDWAETTLSQAPEVETMPTASKRDELKWQKAKEISREKGKGEDYAYIMGVYKRMKPDYFSMKRNGSSVERNLDALIAADSDYRSNSNARNLLILRDRLIILMTVCSFEKEPIPVLAKKIVRNVEKDCGKLHF